MGGLVERLEDFECLSSRHGSGAITDAELAVDVFEVPFNGVHGDGPFVSDGVV